MHYSYPCANSRLGKDIFTRNWRDLPHQILTATTLSKLNPLALDFWFDGIYRLKDCICKYNAIFNWIILDSVYQLRYGHKFVLPTTSLLYHTPPPNERARGYAASPSFWLSAFAYSTTGASSTLKPIFAFMNWAASTVKVAAPSLKDFGSSTSVVTHSPPRALQPET